MSDVSYAPGDRTAIVGERCWLLADAPPDGAAIAEIWQRNGRPPRPDALLAGLLRVGFDRLPDFALLIAAADGRRHLICRGGVNATIVTAAAPARIDGTGLITWREHPVPADAERVFLGEPPAGPALRLPAAAGVLLASCVTVDLTVTAARTAAPPPAEARPVPSAAPPAAALPVPGPPPVTEAHPDTVADPRACAYPDNVAASGAGGHPGPLVYPDTVTLTHPGPADGAPGQVTGAPGPAGDMDYDYLWGNTQMRTVEDAAVRPAAPDDPGLAFPFPAPVTAPHPGPATAPHPGRQPWQPPSRPPARGSDANARPAQAVPGLIDAVPWAAPPAPAAAPSSAAQAGPGLSAADGFTIPRSQLPRGQERDLAPDRIGPTVRALLCPSGHVNPPSSGVCRRCAAPLPQDTVIVPRPVLGVLRLSVGDEITLDRDVVMGRSPRADFTGADGEERPHVVRLPSADGDISRTHLRVSLDGWHVLVTDLNSTNGTLVSMPGRDPEQLRPGEPTPIQPGTVVTLADGIDFRYEVTE
jgi:hypothetical protein